METRRMCSTNVVGVLIQGNYLPLVEPEECAEREYEREVKQLAENGVGELSIYDVVREGNSTAVVIGVETPWGSIRARGKAKRLSCDIECPEMGTLIALGKAVEKLSGKIKKQASKLVNQNENRSAVVRRRAAKQMMKRYLLPSIEDAITRRSKREICTGTD